MSTWTICKELKCWPKMRLFLYHHKAQTTVAGTQLQIKEERDLGKHTGHA